jgi:hypothetical protein
MDMEKMGDSAGDLIADSQRYKTPYTSICSKCSTPIELQYICKRMLCNICCWVQGVRKKCKMHDMSMYDRRLHQMSFEELTFEFNRYLIETSHKLRSHLKNGIY